MTRGTGPDRPAILAALAVLAARAWHDAADPARPARSTAAALGAVYRYGAAYGIRPDQIDRAATGRHRPGDGTHGP